MDTEPTIDEQLLAHAERQTSALEALRNFALILLALMVLGALTWVFVAANAG